MLGNVGKSLITYLGKKRKTNFFQNGTHLVTRLVIGITMARILRIQSDKRFRTTARERKRERESSRLRLIYQKRIFFLKHDEKLLSRHYFSCKKLENILSAIDNVTLINLDEEKLVYILISGSY